MLNSIYIFLMKLAGIECFRCIILTWSEFEIRELGHGHQELLQHGLSCHLLPRQPQEKDVTSLWTRVGFAQKFTQRCTQILLVLQEKKLKLSTIVLIMVYGLTFNKTKERNLNNVSLLRGCLLRNQRSSVYLQKTKCFYLKTCYCN